MQQRIKFISLIIVIGILVSLTNIQSVFSKEEIEIYYIKNANNKTLVHFNAPFNIESIPVEVFDNKGELIKVTVLRDFYTNKNQRGQYNTFILELDNLQSYGKLITNPNTVNSKEYTIYNSPQLVYSNGIYINNNVRNSTKIYPYIEETIQNLNNEVINLEILIAEDKEEIIQLPRVIGDYIMPRDQYYSMELEPGKSLSVMSFNINYGKDRSGFINLDKVAEVIRKSGADIIGLQEVERFSIRSNREDQIAYLAEKLSMHYVYGGNIKGPFIGQYGNAILSKYPIIESQNFYLPSGREQRGMLTTTIGYGNKNINFLVTHLGLSLVERQNQVASILNYLKTIEGEPTILVGDFNALPDSKEIVRINKVLTDVGLYYQELNTYSHHSDTPNVRIDYIFISKNIGLYGAEVLPDKVSDHQPVLALLGIE